MGVNGEALQLHSVYKKPYFFYCKSRENLYQYYKSCKNPYQYYMYMYKSRENPYQVLQVTGAASERAMKSKICMIKSLSLSPYRTHGLISACAYLQNCKEICA